MHYRFLLWAIISISVSAMENSAGALIELEPVVLGAILRLDLGMVETLLKSQKLSLQDVYRNISDAGTCYKFKLEQLAKKIEDYVITVRNHDLYNQLNELTAYCKTTKLKELNKYYEEFKDIANAVRKYDQLHQCPIADHTMLDDIEDAIKAVVPAQEIHTMLCRYYRSMRLMEHAKPKRQEGFRVSDNDEWQSSKVLGLPTHLMKIIAYQALNLTRPKGRGFVKHEKISTKDFY